MSKRGAGSELTHDNWNDEDEPEDAGTFRKASVADMATRKIRTAKRRGDASPAGGGTSIFKEMSGFANFGAKTDSSSAPSFSFFNKDSSKSSSNTTPSFSFGKTDSEPKSSTYGGAENKSSTLPAFSFNSNNSNGTSGSTTKDEEIVPKVNGFGSNKKSVTNEKKTDTPFMKELKSLNETFLKWIKQHLDENVYVNLTPVLEDYKKYFQKLSDKNAIDVNASDKKEISNEKENKPVSTNVKSNESASSGDSGTTEKAAEEPKPAFSFMSKSDDSKKPAFSFGGSKNDESKPSIFGNDSNSSNSGSGMKFGTSAPLTFGGFTDSSSKPFSFGGFATTPVPTPATKDKTEEEENDEDQPPKVIVTEVKEDDAIYENKCKLFYMKDKEYVERGLGTIFLKKAEEKTQLIVRAKTNLGNILLNIIVGPSIGAMMRVGKNNVMIVCIPNPPIDPKSDNKTPVKMLIRVKTSEDADALLKVLEENKGK